MWVERAGQVGKGIGKEVLRTSVGVPREAIFFLLLIKRI